MTSKPTAPIGFTNTVDGPLRSLDTIAPDRDFCLVAWWSYVNVGLRRSHVSASKHRMDGKTKSRKEND
jgi:hypothetical protein